MTVTNSNGCKAVSAPSNVTVNSLPAKPTITQNGNILTCEITASSYQWYLSNSAISNTNNKTYNVSKTGYYKVKITNSNDCVAMSDSLYVVYTGISEFAVTNPLKVTLFPNPVNEELFIELPEFKNTIAQVFDPKGQLIQTITLESSKTLINTGKLERGIYLIKIKSNQGVSVNKFIKN